MEILLSNNLVFLKISLGSKVLIGSLSNRCNSNDFAGTYFNFWKASSYQEPLFHLLFTGSKIGKVFDVIS